MTRHTADAAKLHLPWLTAQIQNADVVSLVARSNNSLDGYVFASIVDSSPVYDPGGLTGLVDDFAVVNPSLWATVGRQLLDEVKRRLAERGVVQVVVVCGHHDDAKRAALVAAGSTVASEWLVAPLIDVPTSARP